MVDFDSDKENENVDDPNKDNQKVKKPRKPLFKVDPQLLIDNPEGLKKLYKHFVLE